MSASSQHLAKTVVPFFAYSLRIRFLLVVLLVAVPAFGFILYTGIEQQHLARTAVSSIPPDIVLAEANKLFLQNLLGLGSATLLALAVAWIIGNRLIVHEIEGLAEIDKLKDEFVSVASHELRTPMTAIKGLVSMMMDGDFGPVNENLQKPLSDVFNSTERLIHLVNDLLNVSRIETGRLKFVLTTFSVDKLIQDTVATFINLAEEKGLSLTIQNTTSTLVQADQDKIGEILNNLVGNALKFTDYGNVYISSEDKGEFVYVTVKDTGIGIAKVDCEKLFGKFEQINSQQIGRPQGTGLGLYISRELVRKMGGDLWLSESHPNRGSTFAFTIPVATSNISDTHSVLET